MRNTGKKWMRPVGSPKMTININAVNAWINHPKILKVYQSKSKQSLDGLDPLKDFSRFWRLWPISQIWGREFVSICSRHILGRESHGSVLLKLKIQCKQCKNQNLRVFTSIHFVCFCQSFRGNKTEPERVKQYHQTWIITALQAFFQVWKPNTYQAADMQSAKLDVFCITWFRFKVANPQYFNKKCSVKRTSDIDRIGKLRICNLPVIVNLYFWVAKRFAWAKGRCNFPVRMDSGPSRNRRARRAARSTRPHVSSRRSGWGIRRVSRNKKHCM